MQHLIATHNNQYTDKQTGQKPYKEFLLHSIIFTGSIYKKKLSGDTGVTHFNKNKSCFSGRGAAPLQGGWGAKR